MAGDRIYTADMGQPPMDPEVAPPTVKKPVKQPPKLIQAPKEPDDASAGRPYKKGEKNVPEQPGELIRVESKASGGSVGSASSRADGICQRGKTKGKLV